MALRDREREREREKVTAEWRKLHYDKLDNL
jgi:hypothetical protein